jgi:hypothetical protein
MPCMMETTCRSSISRSNPFRGFILFALFLLAFCYRFPVSAQTIKLKQHLDLSQPAALSIDRLDNIYLTDRKNNVFKFDGGGQLLNTFSPPRTGNVANIEAWNGMKTLLFYDDRQQVTLLDRFLNNIATINLRDISKEGLIKTATTAADDRLWLFNETEFSLLKYDPRTAEVVSTTPLNLTINRNKSDIRYLREYQNMVYLVDKTTGIYVFDNLGNYKKTLPFPDLQYVGFRGDELFFLAGSQLRFFNLYSFKERSFDLPAGPVYRQALVGEQLIYLLSDNGLDLFTFE